MGDQTLIPCSVMTCGWFWIVRGSDFAEARAEERKHWAEYHETREEE